MDRLSENQIRQIFLDLGAIHCDSHFVYTSGKHGPHYVAKDQVGLDPLVTDQLAFELACRVDEFVCNHSGVILRAVIGAPMGAVRLADRVAFWLNSHFNYGVKSIYAEKKDGAGLFIRSQFQQVISGGGTVIIEDIINSGKSGREMVAAVSTAGGTSVVMGALCNRGKQTAQSLGVPGLLSLLDLDFEAFDVKGMPDWLKAIPVRTDLGHGQKWLDDPENQALVEKWRQNAAK